MIHRERMNPEVRRLWLDALRSGDYRQGTGLLRRVDAASGDAYHCCLGVLCELAVEAGVVRRTETRVDDVDGGVDADADTVVDGDRVTSYAAGTYKFPPPEVLHWAGLRGANPVVEVEEEPRTLVNLNDVQEAPFTAIADAIERSL